MYLYRQSYETIFNNYYFPNEDILFKCIVMTTVITGKYIMI